MCDDIEATVARARGEGRRARPARSATRAGASSPRSRSPAAASSASTSRATRALAGATTRAKVRPDYDRGVVSTLVLRLLGPPEIERDGVIVPPPRGHKAWAVLAYLVLTERRCRGRSWPRWSSAMPKIRAGPCAGRWRSCGAPLGVAGATQRRPRGARVASGDRGRRAGAGGRRDRSALGSRRVVGGLDPGAGPEFDAWLLVERRRLAGVCEAVLRDAALSALAAGHPLDAAALASRAVTLNRFDDGAHELLVRCLREQVRSAPRASTRTPATSCSAASWGAPRIRACAGPPRSATRRRRRLR